MWDTDHLQIRFELGKHGWSSLYLQRGDIGHSIRITHIFEDDPVENLIQFAEDIQRQNYPARIVFRDEPGTHIIELSVETKQNPVLTVFHSKENFQSIDEVEDVGSFDVVPNFIVTQIFAELQRTEQLMRHKLYQKDRTEFPFKRFRQMKSKFNF